MPLGEAFCTFDEYGCKMPLFKNIRDRGKPARSFETVHDECGRRWKAVLRSQIRKGLA